MTRAAAEADRQQFEVTVFDVAHLGDLALDYRLQVISEHHRLGDKGEQSIDEIFADRTLDLAELIDDKVKLPKTGEIPDPFTLRLDPEDITFIRDARKAAAESVRANARAAEQQAEKATAEATVIPQQQRRWFRLGRIFETTPDVPASY